MFLKEFFEKSILKKSADDNKSKGKLPSMQKVKQPRKYAVCAYWRMTVLMASRLNTVLTLNFVYLPIKSTEE